MTIEEQIELEKKNLIEKKNVFKKRLVYYRLNKTEIDFIMNDVLEMAKIIAKFSYMEGRLKK